MAGLGLPTCLALVPLVYELKSKSYNVRKNNIDDDYDDDAAAAAVDGVGDDDVPDVHDHYDEDHAIGDGDYC